MSEQQTVSFSLELDIANSYSEIRKLELVLYRTVALLNRLGMSENMKHGIQDIMRMIATIRMLHRALQTLHAAYTAGMAANPLTWPLAILGIVTAVASASDFVLSSGE
jgi:hypothetical protein